MELYGELLEYSVHSRSQHEFSTLEEAEIARDWLTRANKRYGFRFDVQSSLEELS